MGEGSALTAVEGKHTCHTFGRRHAATGHAGVGPHGTGPAGDGQDASASVCWLRRHRMPASMKPSMSPSNTAGVLPTS